jgi:hypothetical protein
MSVCETCGNDYHRPITVVMDGVDHVFDSFECAIHALAASCVQCGCRIIGHGIEGADGACYCCAHCARAGGEDGARDNVAMA